MQRYLIDDNELLEHVIEDPSRGVGEALEAYGAAVKTICVNILGKDAPEDVEECVSDVFLELWKNAARFNSTKGTVKAYIYGIARHKAVDMFRKKARKDETALLDDAEVCIETDFTDEIAQRKNAAIIQEAIDDMPSPDKEIFIYRYYFYHKIKDIADRLSLPPKTVENKLSRGKAALRKELVERGIVL